MSTPAERLGRAARLLESHITAAHELHATMVRTRLALLATRAAFATSAAKGDDDAPAKLEAVMARLVADLTANIPDDPLARGFVADLVRALSLEEPHG